MLQATTKSQQAPQTVSAAVLAGSLPASRGSGGGLAAGDPPAQAPRPLLPQPSGRPPLPPTEMLRAQVISHTHINQQAYRYQDLGRGELSCTQP